MFKYFISILAVGWLGSMSTLQQEECVGAAAAAAAEGKSSTRRGEFRQLPNSRIRYRAPRPWRSCPTCTTEPNSSIIWGQSRSTTESYQGRQRLVPGPESWWPAGSFHSSIPLSICRARVDRHRHGCFEPGLLLLRPRIALPEAEPHRHSTFLSLSFRNGRCACI